MICPNCGQDNLPGNEVCSNCEQDLTKLPSPQNGYKPKKTEWGEPDFRGGWPIDSLTGRTPLQREAKFGDRQLLTDVEFKERSEMVTKLENRYQDESSQNKLGIGHWAEVGPLTTKLSAQEIAGWLAQRRSHLMQGRSRLRVGHVDIFARPIGTR